MVISEPREMRQTKMRDNFYLLFLYYMPNGTSEPFTKQSCEISVIMSSLVIWDQKPREIKLFAHDHRHRKEWL